MQRAYHRSDKLPGRSKIRRIWLRNQQNEIGASKDLLNSVERQDDMLSWCVGADADSVRMSFEKGFTRRSSAYF